MEKHHTITLRPYISTSAFWLLVFSFGTLYALFTGWEIRMPAGNVEAEQVASIFDDADNLMKHHRKGQ